MKYLSKHIGDAQCNGSNPRETNYDVMTKIHDLLLQMNRDGYLAKNKYTPAEASIAANLNLIRDIGNTYRLAETGQRWVLSGIKDYDAFLNAENSKLRHMQSGININVNGNGNSFSVSGNNQKLNIHSGNKQELYNELNNLKIDEEDIFELFRIIESAEDKTENLTNIDGWIAKMVEKAKNGLWQVAANTAGSVLAGLVQMYFGFPRC